MAEGQRRRGSVVTGDIRKQLIEALDEAEKHARELLVMAQRTSLAVQEPALLGRCVPGWYAWPDVEAMCARELRMIERDRQLLADVVMVEEQQREHSAKLLKTWKPGGDEASIPRLQEHAERVGGRLDALTAEVERAVTFWLGTPEVDR
jgi:hypothetical protein